MLPCSPPPPSLLSFSFFFSLRTGRIVYVAWVWLTSMAGTCVDHYWIKVLQYIQPGFVLSLHYAEWLLHLPVLLFLPLVLSSVHVREPLEPDFFFFFHCLHWCYLHIWICSYLTHLPAFKGLFKDLKCMSLYYRYMNTVPSHFCNRIHTEKGKGCT